MAGASESLRVFISYARSDASAFADELMAGLEAAGFDPFLDRHDIVPGEDWETRLGKLLQQADSVVYVLSPASIASERCAWEIERAGALAKRVLPVVSIDVAEADTPEKLRRLNYIYFTQGHSFGAGLKQLTTALRTDIDWIREHTRIAELSARWRERGGEDSMLMRGGELEGAKAWLASWRPGAPEPTANQREFINASEASEQLRTSEQQQQLNMLIKVQRSRNRMAVLLFTLIGAITVVAGAAVYLFHQRVADRDHYIAALQEQLEADRTRVIRETEAFGRDIVQDLPTIAPGAQAPAAAPAPRAESVERSVGEIETAANRLRSELGWRIDIFACEGVAGAQQRAERLHALLASERNRQIDGGGSLSFAIGRTQLRALSAAQNARSGYGVTRDEIRGEAGETDQVNALRAFVGANGVTLATRRSTSPTVSYLSIFICNAD